MQTQESEIGKSYYSSRNAIHLLREILYKNALN